MVHDLQRRHSSHLGGCRKYFFPSDWCAGSRQSSPGSSVPALGSPPLWRRLGTMSETQTLFAALRQSADAAAADELERMVREAEDRALNRINVIDLAARTGIDEQ